MADRGRDLSFDLRTDTSKFDLSEPASELEDLGSASKDAAQDIDKTTDELKRLAAQGKDAQRALDQLNKEVASDKFDQLGKDAKAAATKVDAAMDSVARSTKTSMDKVEKEGREGFKDFKEEAGQSGREAAQSFSGGFSDIGDFLQETAAQAFAGFGPLGAAAGVAGALGIGLITNAFQNMQAAAEKAKERANNFFDALVEGGGRLKGSAIADEIQNLIKDDDQWDKLTKAIKGTTIAKGDYIAALAGDAAARQRVVAQIDAEIASTGQQVTTTIDARNAQQDHIDSLRTLRGEVTKTGGEFDRANTKLDANTEAMKAAGIGADGLTDSERALADQQARSQKAQDDLTAARQQADTLLAQSTALLDSFASGQDDVATAVQEAATKEAAANKDKGKSWQDYAGKVKITADQIIAQQNADIRARETFNANMRKVFAAGGQDALDWVKSQGTNAAAAAQAFADAPKAKQGQIVANYKKEGKQAGQATADGLLETKGANSASAEAIHAEVLRILAQVINIPTALLPPTPAELAATAEAVKRHYLANPIPISTVLRRPVGTGNLLP